MHPNEKELNLGPRKQVATALAQRLLKESGIVSAPVSLRTIIEHLQCERDLDVIGSQEFSQKVSGLLVVCNNEEETFVTIGFNENHPWCRRRYTIGHEIGHLLLGHGCSGRGTEGSQNETEANIFSAELLIPRSFLELDFKSTPAIPSLSKKYLVSSQALSIKLMTDKLI